MRQAIGVILEDHDLEFAADQRSAFKLLETQQFDVMLLDLRLPRFEGDMNESNDVGLDILQQVRSKGLLQTGGRRPLPVVVMTAHGSEATAATVLVQLKAQDYIPKPFESAEHVQLTIDLAVAGRGANAWRGLQGPGTLRIAFNDDSRQVRIEDQVYSGEHSEVLFCLRAPLLADQDEGLDPSRLEGIRNKALAKKLAIGEEAARKRIDRLRTALQEGLSHTGRNIGRMDLVESTPWHGYRLSPTRLRVVDWSILDPV